MGDQENEKEQKPEKTPFTFFGEQIIKTNCQRNAFITAISGGIFGGLIGFLFTSNPRNSTRIGVATYFTIGVTYACYCAYEEIQTKQQRRLLKQIIYENRKHDKSKDAESNDAPVRLESA